MKRLMALLLAACILLTAAAASAAEPAGFPGAAKAAKVKVRKITPDQTRLMMAPNTTWTVYCTVEPADASNKSVSWSSSNEKVATVNAYGVVRALKEGTCRISCKAKDGSGANAGINVQVKKFDVVIRNPGDLAVKFETAPAMVSVTLRNTGKATTKNCERQFRTENECVSSPKNKVLRPLKAGTDTITLNYVESKKTVKTDRYTVFVAPSAVGETMRLQKNGKPAAITFLGLPWGSAWPDVRDALEKQNRGLKTSYEENDRLRSMLDVEEIRFGNITAYAAAANFSFTPGDRMREVRNSLFRGDLYFAPDIPYGTVMLAVRKVYALGQGTKTTSNTYAWKRGHVSVTLTRAKRYTVLSLTWDGKE